MTVKELISQLKELDQNRRVFVRGYEGGYGEVNEIHVTEMALNVHVEWWFGEHEKASDKHHVKDPGKYDTVNAVVLMSKRED